MDIHLDSLLRLPNITVFTCYQKEEFMILELELINQGINCPHCQIYTDKLHQNRPILVRDLSICGQGVYLMEGINNKIKLIIRQSYGFKTFDSLRLKLLACLF